MSGELIRFKTTDDIRDFASDNCCFEMNSIYYLENGSLMIISSSASKNGYSSTHIGLNPMPESTSDILVERTAKQSYEYTPGGEVTFIGDIEYSTSKEDFRDALISMAGSSLNI